MTVILKFFIFILVASHSYQMTMLIKCMVALFRQSKKSLMGFASFSMLPKMRPKAMQKTRIPKILTPSTVPGIGTVLSTRVPEIHL